MREADAMRLLLGALELWKEAPAERLDEVLRDVEVFALATIAVELRELRLTLQARHEEALARRRAQEVRP